MTEQMTVWHIGKCQSYLVRCQNVDERIRDQLVYNLQFALPLIKINRDFECLSETQAWISPLILLSIV